MTDWGLLFSAHSDTRPQELPKRPMFFKKPKSSSLSQGVRATLRGAGEEVGGTRPSISAPDNPDKSGAGQGRNFS